MLPVFKGRIFNVTAEKVTLPNGVVADREVVRHPGAVAIVPILDDEKVVLIKQYRHAIKEYIYEIPAGLLEPGEDPLECAGRELIEETGYKAGHLMKLTEIYPAPGYTDEIVHVFLAYKLSQDKQNLEEGEIIEIEVVPIKTALGMVFNRGIRDAKSIVGLLMIQSTMTVTTY